MGWRWSRSGPGSLPSIPTSNWREFVSEIRECERYRANEQQAGQRQSSRVILGVGYPVVPGLNYVAWRPTDNGSP